MKRFKILQVGLVASLTLGFLAGSAQAFSSIVWGFPGLYDPEDPCPGPDTPGGTTLRDIHYLLAPSDAFIGALEWQFSGENRYTATATHYRPPGERWSFDWGGPLFGTLFIDEYTAYDDHHGFNADDEIVWDPDGDWCRHGAHLSASYIRDPQLDPLDLDWVQVFVASYDKHGVPAGTPLADPFYNDGTDDGPFYFSNEDDPTDFYRGANLFADWIFGDTPGSSHLESTAYHVSLDLQLFLASRDPLNPRHVFIHDGISWGYEGICIPAPASLTIALIGLGLIRALRRRRVLS
jgi:hypothetical protein